jgi:Flp pilus assembly protein protease CpaA
MLWKHGTLATALLLTGLIIMEALVICDIRARILPWEGCLALVILGALLRLLDGDLLASTALAVLIFAMLFGSSALVSRGESRALGWGDLRLIPALVLIGGPVGTLYGGLTCAVAACVHALICLVARKASAAGAFPLGPSLLVWFLVAALC